MPAIAWGLTFLLLGYIYVVIFPQYKEAAGALSENSYFQALAGEGGPLNTPSGYLTAEFFTSAPLLVLIFAIIASTGLIAGEESSGTLDLVLAQPISRVRLLVEKVAALALLVVAVSLAAVPGMALGQITVDFPISTVKLIEACLNMVPVALLFAALGVLGTAVIGGRTGTAILVIGAAIAAFFLNTFGAFIHALDEARKVSPFYWANYGRVLTKGFDWETAALIVLAAMALLALSAIAFQTRDIATGAGWWGRLRRSSRSNDLPTAARAPSQPTSHPPVVTVRARRWPTMLRTLREQRWTLLAWSVAVLVLAFIYVVIYPQFRDTLKAFDEAGAFRPFAGEAGKISSPAGYLNVEFFSYVPLLILIAAVIAGTGAIAAEEAAGTLELLLAQPIRRWRMLAEKVAALVAFVVLIVLACLPGLLIASGIVDFQMSAARLTAASLTILPITLLYLSLAVFCSTTLPGRTSAAIVVVGAAIAGYFLNLLGAYLGGLDLLRKLSPFYWADFSRAMLYGFDWARAAGFVALSLAFLIAAAVVFERRDLSTGSRTWRLRRHPPPTVAQLPPGHGEPVS